MSFFSENRQLENNCLFNFFFTRLCHVKLLSIRTPESFSCLDFFICVPVIFMLMSISVKAKRDSFAFDRINIALVFSKLKAMPFS